MEGQNAEVVERWLESFTDDADAFRETLHPDIEWSPFEENHTPSRGIEGAMRIRNGWIDTWDHMQAEVEQVVEEDDSVVASIHIRGRGKTSGAEVEVRLHMHFKVRDGKIVYLFEHTDRAAALEAAGISAMSRENVETVRRALASSDPEALLAILDDQVEWDYVGAFPEAVTYHGPGEVREFLHGWAAAFDDFGFEGEELIDAGDSVAVHLHQWGHGKETGARVESRTWQLFTLRDGKIVRCRGFATRAEALEAAGLSEELPRGAADP